MYLLRACYISLCVYFMRIFCYEWNRAVHIYCVRYVSRYSCLLNFNRGHIFKIPPNVNGFSLSLCRLVASPYELAPKCRVSFHPICYCRPPSSSTDVLADIYTQIRAPVHSSILQIPYVPVCVFAKMVKRSSGSMSLHLITSLFSIHFAAIK